MGPTTNGVTKNESETPSFELTVTVFERDASIAKKNLSCEPILSSNKLNLT